MKTQKTVLFFFATQGTAHNLCVHTNCVPTKNSKDREKLGNPLYAARGLYLCMQHCDGLAVLCVPPGTRCRSKPARSWAVPPASGQRRGRSSPRRQRSQPLSSTCKQPVTSSPLPPSTGPAPGSQTGGFCTMSFTGGERLKPT